jgi:transposase
MKPGQNSGRISGSKHGSQTDDKEAYAREFPVHVGVDTGKEFHKLVARGPDGRRTKAVRVDVGREGFDAADKFLTEKFPGIPRDRMLIGLEFAGHYGLTFAHYLADRGYRIVTVLPSVTKKLKEVEDNSPRKDDAKDAAQICRLVGSGLFVGFSLLEEHAAALRTLTTERERLTREETRLKNRLQSLLDLVWPEFMDHFHNLTKATPRALLARWATPYELLSERPETIRSFIRDVSRNHFKREAVDALLIATAGTVGLTVGLEARASEIRRIMTRWTLLQEHMAAVDKRLAALVDEIPAAKALTTVPGVSVVCATSIVAELGDPGSYVSPRQVLKLAGMNLAGKQSGVSVNGRVKQTKRGRPALRRQLFLLAGRWCQKRALYREQYLALRARNGGKKTSAMCAVARKLVPMLLHIMQTGEPFDTERWCVAHGVPLPAPRVMRKRRKGKDEQEHLKGGEGAQQAA